MASNNKGPVWLASFHKSGNTWVRLLLANLLYADEKPVDINQLALPGWCPVSRPEIDQLTLIDTSLLTRSEVDLLRPQWTGIVTAEATERGYFKTHDTWRINANGEPVLGKNIGSDALYIVRDPRDVAVSLAHHFGCSIDRAIDYLNQGFGDPARMQRRCELRFDDFMYSWSLHVTSWLDQRDIPVHLIRYEDLLANPRAVFGAAVAFLQLAMPTEAIERAVRFSAFDLLQRQEQGQGFREKSQNASAPFFRSGRAGSWSEVLSAGQQQRLIDAHRPVMERLGYL